MKTIKKIKAALYFWYVYKKESFSLNKEALLNYHALNLITVCFNNSDIIKVQYEYIRKNLLDDFIYIIADNSDNESEIQKLLSFADENKLVYIKLPSNPYSYINPSKSHGLGINFICKKILQINNFGYVGFIDQDIFPISKTSIIKKINNQPYFGLVQKRKAGSYLWAGFCFYSKEFLSKNKIDFMPTKGLDTGGSNYKIYNKQLLHKILIKHYYLKTKTGQKTEKPFEGMQNESVEFIDEWMHIMNSSSWLNTYDTKEKCDFINNMIK